MKVKFEIENLEDLDKAIGRVCDAVSYYKVAEVVLSCARELAEDVRSRIPIGPRGNLKRSVVARLMPRSKVPVAITAIDRKIAPHAHLIEFGTDIRRVKKKKALYSEFLHQFFGKQVAGVRPRPFFRPAWDANRHRIQSRIAEAIKGSIEAAI